MTDNNRSRDDIINDIEKLMDELDVAEKKEEVAEDNNNQSGEEEEVAGSNKDNNQLLLEAVKIGATMTVKNLILLDGVSVDYKQIGEDASLLSYAASNGNLEICQVLLEAGANILTVDDTYFTPLQVALEKNHVNVVQLLLAPSVAARNDSTCILHWMAAANASIEHLRYVLETGGADATVEDDEGRLAWQWAAENHGNACAVAVLLREAATIQKIQQNNAEDVEVEV